MKKPQKRNTLYTGLSLTGTTGKARDFDFGKKSIENDVADYYNNNTSRFLGSGKKKYSGAIHRKLYPPVSVAEPDPAHYSDSLVLEIMRDMRAERVLDLGCGVGGCIRYLRNRYQADYTGISLSQVQCEIALELDTKIEHGNYLDPLWYNKREPFDLIYAIESLQHNPDHNLLACNLGKVMKPGSRLVVIDDFLKTEKPLSNREIKLISRFQKHWHSHGYTSQSDLIEILSQNGLILYEQTKLTHLMAKPLLNRHLREVLLNGFSILPVEHSALDNIIGGGTLLLLQQLGLSEYSLLVFGHS